MHLLAICGYMCSHMHLLVGMKCVPVLSVGKMRSHTHLLEVCSHMHLLFDEMHSQMHMFARCVPTHICLGDVFLFTASVGDIGDVSVDGKMCSRTYLFVRCISLHICWRYAFLYASVGDMRSYMHLLAMYLLVGCIPVHI